MNNAQLPVQLHCDIIINMTGVYVKTLRCEYGPYKSRPEAEYKATLLGFIEWSVWEYEHHVCDVYLDKRTLVKGAVA